MEECLQCKHASLRYELENNYTDKQDIEAAHLQHISSVIRRLNKEFGYSNCDEYDHTRLYRKKKQIYFKNTVFHIRENTTETDVYDCFYPIMKKYYNQYTILFRKKIKEKEEFDKKHKEYVELQLKPQLEKLKRQINSCNNKAWNMDFHIDIFSCHCLITLSLLGYWSGNINLFIGDVDKKDFKIKDVIAKEMNRLYELGINGCHKYIPMFYSEIRIMEEC